MFGNFGQLVDTVQRGQNLYNLVQGILGQIKSGGLRPKQLPARQLPEVRVGLNGVPVITSGKPSNSSAFDFFANFKNGIAKPTRYRLEFNLPSGVSGSQTQDSESKVLSANIRREETSLNRSGAIAIKCHTMTLPPRIFQVHEVKYNNSSFKLPHGVTYEPVTFTFYSDSQLDTIRYFDTWQSSVMNFSNNTMNFFNEYVSDINIFICDDAGDDVYGITLFEAYPMGIAAVEYSYTATNIVLNVSVTFAYRYFLPMESSQSINRAT